MHHALSMALVDRLILQQREMQSKIKHPYIQRSIPDIENTGGLITVITGPRRAGKSTTALCQIIEGIPAAYINFDDEELASVQDFLAIESALRQVYGNYEILVLDEIQNLPRWELIVNRLHRQGVRLVITGSNAHLLSSELATHLTGRYIPVWILPFSFDEFLAARTDVQLISSEYPEFLHQYIETGGYPEVVLGKADNDTYLNTLIQAVLFKDIVRRYHIRSPQAIEDLSLCLISNPAVEYSYANLGELTRTSTNTVKKYLQYLHQSFLFFSIPRFSWKVREQISSSKKIYLTDTGCFSARSVRHSLHIGRMYENLTAIYLYRQELYGSCRLSYWKSQQGEEVDFVIQSGTEIKSLIQVSFDISQPKTLKREIRALIKASKELKCDNLILVTESEERMIEADWYGKKGTIRVVPLYKFLLGMVEGIF
ncbi:ATP-binding protein [Methanospirillum hungatei]|uniref:ATP-binding protein n=1 Tax=Methanospirillum hungatei TaxID=2203 RepID=UPI0026EC0C5A|nr:ATP-binding protein [Methanospirillum hungatei]MCA1916733.1 ATP-binding protein [Methanospirillum hungatei]